MLLALCCSGSVVILNVIVIIVLVVVVIFVVFVLIVVLVVVVVIAMLMQVGVARIVQIGTLVGTVAMLATLVASNSWVNLSISACRGLSKSHSVSFGVIARLMMASVSIVINRWFVSS